MDAETRTRRDHTRVREHVMTGGKSERKQTRPQRRAACVAARMGRPVRQLVDREQAVPLAGRAVAGGAHCSATS